MPFHHPGFPTTVGVDLTDFSPASLSQCWKEHQCRVGTRHRDGHTCLLTDAVKLCSMCPALLGSQGGRTFSSHWSISTTENLSTLFLPIDNTAIFSQVPRTQVQLDSESSTEALGGSGRVALADSTRGSSRVPETQYLSRNLARTALSREKLTASQNSSSKREKWRVGGSADSQPDREHRQRCCQTPESARALSSLGRTG